MAILRFGLAGLILLLTIVYAFIRQDVRRVDTVTLANAQSASLQTTIDRVNFAAALTLTKEAVENLNVNDSNPAGGDPSLSMLLAMKADEISAAWRDRANAEGVEKDSFRLRSDIWSVQARALTRMTEIARLRTEPREGRIQRLPFVGWFGEEGAALINGVFYKPSLSKDGWGKPEDDYAANVAHMDFVASADPRRVFIIRRFEVEPGASARPRQIDKIDLATFKTDGAPFMLDTDDELVSALKGALLVKRKNGENGAEAFRIIDLDDGYATIDFDNLSVNGESPWTVRLLRQKRLLAVFQRTSGSEGSGAAYDYRIRMVSSAAGAAEAALDDAAEAAPELEISSGQSFDFALNTGGETSIGGGANRFNESLVDPDSGLLAVVEDQQASEEPSAHQAEKSGSAKIQDVVVYDLTTMKEFARCKSITSSNEQGPVDGINLLRDGKLLLIGHQEAELQAGGPKRAFTVARLGRNSCLMKEFVVPPRFLRFPYLATVFDLGNVAGEQGQSAEFLFAGGTRRNFTARIPVEPPALDPNAGSGTADYRLQPSFQSFEDLVEAAIAIFGADGSRVGAVTASAVDYSTGAASASVLSLKQPNTLFMFPTKELEAPTVYGEVRYARGAAGSSVTFVAAKGVGVIDATTEEFLRGETFEQIGVDRPSFSPKVTNVSDSGRYAYISNSSRNEVTLVDLRGAPSRKFTVGDESSPDFVMEVGVSEDDGYLLATTGGGDILYARIPATLPSIGDSTEKFSAVRRLLPQDRRKSAPRLADIVAFGPAAGSNDGLLFIHQGSELDIADLRSQDDTQNFTSAVVDALLERATGYQSNFGSVGGSDRAIRSLIIEGFAADAGKNSLYLLAMVGERPERRVIRFGLPSRSALLLKSVLSDIARTPEGSSGAEGLGESNNSDRSSFQEFSARPSSTDALDAFAQNSVSIKLSTEAQRILGLIPLNFRFSDIGSAVLLSRSAPRLAIVSERGMVVLSTKDGGFQEIHAGRDHRILANAPPLVTDDFLISVALEHNFRGNSDNGLLFVGSTAQSYLAAEILRDAEGEDYQLASPGSRFEHLLEHQEEPIRSDYLAVVIKGDGILAINVASARYDALLVAAREKKFRDFEPEEVADYGLGHLESVDAAISVLPEALERPEWYTELYIGTCLAIFLDKLSEDSCLAPFRWFRKDYHLQARKLIATRARGSSPARATDS